MFYFVFESNSQVQAPEGAYIQRGDFKEGCLRFEFVGLIFGGPYTWRGLQCVFSEFYGIEISDYKLLLKLLRHRTSSLSHSFLIGNLRSEDGDGRESVAEKVNSRSFNFHRDYSKSLTFSNVGEPS